MERVGRRHREVASGSVRRMTLAAVVLGSCAALVAALWGGAGALGAADAQGGLQPVAVDVAERWRGEPLDQPRQLRLPPGFRVGVFAGGLSTARFMAFGPDGDLYVTQHRAGRVSRLRDADRDGVADQVTVFAEGLRLPHGLAFRDNWLYVGETHQVIRLADTDGNGSADLTEVVVPNLPAGDGHFTRTVAFGPDGALYVSVGSSCNVCLEEDERRAALLRFEPDGSGGRVLARGLRNSVGVAFHPATGELWATDNGRDRLGDDEPPEEINVVRDGAHYGWPHCHGQRQPDPEFGRPDFCPTTEPPALEMQAHSAPLGLAFSGGAQLPPEYAGDLFVAFHGSWNRTVPTGYKVVRVRVEDGRPVGHEDFAVGWLEADGNVWGRPVDVAVAPDGSLLVSDDRGGVIYRIWYAGS